MSACYFLGAKRITSKKSGKDYFPASFLALNSWGDWDKFTKFCASEGAYQDLIANVPVGYPVQCSLDMQGALVQCVPVDGIVPLDLAEEGGVI